MSVKGIVVVSIVGLCLLSFNLIANAQDASEAYFNCGDPSEVEGKLASNGLPGDEREIQRMHARLAIQEKTVEELGGGSPCYETTNFSCRSQTTILNAISCYHESARTNYCCYTEMLSNVGRGLYEAGARIDGEDEGGGGEEGGGGGDDDPVIDPYCVYPTSVPVYIPGKIDTNVLNGDYDASELTDIGLCEVGACSLLSTSVIGDIKIDCYFPDAAGGPTEHICCSVDEIEEELEIPADTSSFKTCDPCFPFKELNHFGEYEETFKYRECREDNMSEDDIQDEMSCNACVYEDPFATDLVESGLIWTELGCLDTSPVGIITRIFQIGLGLLGGVGILRIIQIAVVYQSGDQEKIAEAREMIVSLVAGLVLMIAGITFLQFIGVNLLGLPEGFLGG